MTRTEQKKHDAKVAALTSRLEQGGSINPETLARSYGLEKEEVERIIRNRRV